MLHRPENLVVSVLLLIVLLAACGQADDPTTEPSGGEIVGNVGGVGSTISVDPSATVVLSELTGTDWVLVNAPHFLEPPDMPGLQVVYNTAEGLRAVVNGLQPREPVTEPTPFPTPAASLDDPGSLVLQPADLPGRYGCGDDGYSPAYECNIGPGYFSSEGGYDDLQMAAGEFLST